MNQPMNEFLPALPEIYLAAAACVLLLFDLFFGRADAGQRVGDTNLAAINAVTNRFAEGCIESRGSGRGARTNQSLKFPIAGFSLVVGDGFRERARERTDSSVRP